MSDGHCSEGRLIRSFRIVLMGLLGLVPALTAAAPRMQAAVIQGARIRVESVPRPAPAAEEVLVKVNFAGVNPADWKRASGRPEDPGIGQPRANAPAIPGLDASGVIVAAGPAVRRWKVGDAVLLWSPHSGTYAQYVAVPATDVALKPARLPYAEAAGVAHAGLAAWNLLIDVARIRAGQTVLVLGGAGGVGSAAVQIAHLRGARVIATASARNQDYLHELGADTVIDYGTQHFEEQLRGVDIVLNTVDADNAFRGLSVLRRGGTLVSLAGLPSTAQCAAHGVICSGRTVPGTSVTAVLQQLTRWAQDGRFRLHIDQTFELGEVLQAWTYSQAGHTRGKTVIRIPQDPQTP
jgi:NADPH:quinone reductase-like Zn-dependent oxidoreductase